MPDGFIHWSADREQIGRFVHALFRYSETGTFASLRAFNDRDSGVFRIQSHRIGEDWETLILAALELATVCANARAPVVFCPPIATFKDPKSATEADLANGLALSVECDRFPKLARAKLEALLGPATIMLASGGIWTDPETGELEDKLHLHWRLSEATRTAEEHRALKQVRDLATRFVDGDPTSKPAVHPMRWPGSWHRKGQPRLASIVSETDSEIHLSHAVELLAEAVGPEARPAASPAIDQDSGEERP